MSPLRPCKGSGTWLAYPVKPAIVILRHSISASPTAPLQRSRIAKRRLQYQRGAHSLGKDSEQRVKAPGASDISQPSSVSQPGDGGGHRQEAQVPEAYASSALAAPVDALQMARRTWGAMPARKKIVLASSAAFFFSNLDKVILSIAIIPMAAEMGWSPSVSGLVQSSFFYGYILVQLPGGYVITRTGGRRILPAGVGLWSLATAAVPLAIATVPTLCLARSLVGLGQGLAPASASDIIAKTVPSSQRSGAVAFVFSGLQIGSIVALLAGPAIIQALGWRMAFYIFGGSGIVWCLWWEQLLGNTYDTGLAASEKALEDGAEENAANVAETASGDAGTVCTAPSEGGLHMQGSTGGLSALEDGAEERRGEPAGPLQARQALEEEKEGDGEVEEVPWRAFIREPAMQGLMYVHFCNNWFHYTMLAWLPTFYIQTLDLDLIAASQLALLPPVAAFAGSNVAGPLADSLIESGTQTVMVRKGMQGVAFVVPSLLLAGAALCSGPSDNHEALVAFLTLSLGFNAFTMAGLYSNHADLSPKHCSALLSITNTAGALPGILGVTFTGVVLQRTDDWSLALFLPCIFFFLTGFAIYVVTASSDEKEFNNNEPFEFERSLPRLPWRPAKDKPQ